MVKCLICDTEFPKQGRKGFCSERCRDVARRKRRTQQLKDMRIKSAELRDVKKEIDPKWLTRGEIK